MPLRHFFTILCFLILNKSFSQTNNSEIQKIFKNINKCIDSSQFDQAKILAKQAKLLHLSKTPDTLSLRINNKFADIYLWQGLMDSSFHYCKLGLKLANNKSVKNSRAYAETLELTGRNYSFYGNYNETLNHHSESLKLKINLFPKHHRTIAVQHILLGNAYENLKLNNVALQCYENALKILNDTKGEYTLKRWVYSDLSNNYSDQGKFKLAIKYCLRGIEMSKKLKQDKSMSMAGAYINLARIYQLSKNYDKALAYNQLAKQLFIDIGKKDHYYVGSIYFNIGGIYTQLFQFKNSLIFFKKALPYYQKNLGSNHYYVGNCYIAIGKVYKELKQPNRALEFYYKALPIINATNNPYTLAEIQALIGSCHFDLNNLSKAEKHLNNAIKLAENFPNKSLSIDYHNRLGFIHLRNKKFEKAISYLLKNVPYIDHKSLNKDTFYTYFLLTRCHSELSQLNKVNHYLKLMNQHVNINNNASSNQINNGTEFNITSQFLIAQYFYLKDQFYKTKNNKYLDSVETNINRFITTQEQWDRSLPNVRDKYYRLDKYLSVYHDQIDYYRINDRFNDALYIVEKTKARQLNSRVNIEEIGQFKNIPSTLLQLEKQLNQELSYYDRLKLGVQNDSINQKLFELRVQKDSLYQLIKNKYPKFHQLKYGHDVVTLNKLQSSLKQEEVIIEYILGNEYIYLMTISKQNCTLKRINKTEKIKLWISQLRNSIYSYDDEKQTNQYLTSAHQLYKTLIAPIKSELKQKLIIIPDGELNYIPFETLLEEKVDQFTSYKDLPYLIKNHQISYNYSATLYHQLLTQKSKAARENLIAFAPSFKDNKEKFETITERRNGFENLLYNIPEAEMAHEYISGRLFKGNTATEENFLKNAGNYKIIHLSTHAKSNDELGDYSFIAMSKVNDSINDANRIYTSELYNLDLKADMVVLSACETGLGELQKGEGIISLARAFTYAGAKSTINSLWSVNDASTKTLMEEFYKNIKAGKTKDQALHEAKLSYLENEDMDAPYFWASFIAMGNMEPIALSSGFNYWWLLAIPLIFGILFLIRRKQ